MGADEIVNALIAASLDKIWVRELPLYAGSSRVDFWTLEPAASKGFRAVSYEVKISRGDYRRDGAGKQAPALTFCDRFFYVTPVGLISKNDLPEWAGLIEWDGKHLHIKRRAPKRQKRAPDWDFVVAALRGSAQFGRDYGLTLAENRFLKHRLNMIEEAQERKRRFEYERWIAKSRPATQDTE